MDSRCRRDPVVFARGYLCLMVFKSWTKEDDMSTNGFREEELVSRRVKIGNEWQTKIFPIVAGRLRLAHEENQNLSLQTEMVNWDGQYAVFKCCAVTGKGQFIGYGTADNQRDERLAESLIDLAETRSISRALRFAGYGRSTPAQKKCPTWPPQTRKKCNLAAKCLYRCSPTAITMAKRTRQRQVSLRLRQWRRFNVKGSVHIEKVPTSASLTDPLDAGFRGAIDGILLEMETTCPQDYVSCRG